MDFRRFVDEHRDSWRRLQGLLDRLDRGGIDRLDAEEVRDLARLYRKASADLLLARNVAARADVVDYLEGLVGRAYTAIYRPRTVAWRGFARFFTHGYPERFRRERRYVALAAAVFFAGFAVAFVLVLLNPASFDSIVPAEVASFYGERPEDHRAERFSGLDGDDGSGSAAFSSMLMVNNIRVSLRAFALGLTFGVGTVAVLFSNGVLIGAIAANFLRWELSVELWALLLPHGVVEIFAVLLGSAGGLVLADALLRPGRRRRLDALRERGLDALLLAAPAVPLLVFAGIVEGYITPMAVLPDAGKLAFAGLTAVALIVYLRAPWLERAEEALSPRDGG